MNENLFRKESLDHIASPEQLNDYIRVPNPSIWLIISLFLILAVVVIFWAFSANLPVVVQAQGIFSEDGIVCFLPVEEAQSLSPGMVVKIDEKEGKIQSISPDPISKEEASVEIGAYQADKMIQSPWNQKIILIPSEEIANHQFLSIKITTDTIKPIDLIFDR
ncbi:MAG: hypothetical protein GYA26_06990 [Flexilinea flocculi]|jgi:hypothetical protein|nr:hypothetical protein [Flexilinea flocculi]